MRGRAGGALQGVPAGDLEGCGRVASGPEFAVEGTDEVVYQGYLTMFERKVWVTPTEGGDARLVRYDVVGNPRVDYAFVAVFPFDPERKTVTLVREYAQGDDCVCYALPTGGFDPRKHADLETAAVAELSEEARLTGGDLQRLLPASHPGFLEAKWCRNRCTPFLCVGPRVDPSPGHRDAEEAGMQVVDVRVDNGDLDRLMHTGLVLPPSVVVIGMALASLRKQGLLD